MIGCKYCQQIKESSQKELRGLYQENLYANVYLGKSLNRPALIVERGKCPTYAECGFKNVGITSVFFINYCPNCGADLTKDKVQNW